MALRLARRCPKSYFFTPRPRARFCWDGTVYKPYTSSPSLHFTLNQPPPSPRIVGSPVPHIVINLTLQPLFDTHCY
ncbi:hypothetical protein A0H81_01808 [Grifola frondosa]|uniref:Uncharacterized protein n=1 Tax=Grifola frondosa TaxID=5627 RepID=A0A1C7MSJ9_GRIFR|nr:hypothetical protein A0H81_01808 [Grifola frondosa]